MTRTDILIGLILLGLLAFSGSMQMGMKGEPLLVMLVFGVLTLLSLLMNLQIANRMFMLLFGVILAMAYFVLTFMLASSMTDPFVDSNGVVHATMPTGELFLGLLSSLILTPWTMLKFYKLQWHHRTIKIVIMALFCLMMAVIYYVSEVRYW